MGKISVFIYMALYSLYDSKGWAFFHSEYGRVDVCSVVNIGEWAFLLAEARLFLLKAVGFFLLIIMLWFVFWILSNF